MTDVTFEFGSVFKPLVPPSRYKGAWGGRGSGKSHFFAELLILKCLQAKTDWVCIREVQKTLAQSAKKLLENKIQALGVGHLFEVLTDRIKTPHGGVIIFQGMQDHTAESIKSLEGFDGAWVEEAQTLSATSLTLLRPTIRKAGSELWFSWNPRSKKDPVDVMLRGAEKPTGAVVVKANWSDNKRFPAELEQERRDCLRSEPDKYEHIWEGGYVTLVDGAYYAKQIMEARKENRICRLNRDKMFRVRMYVDIGGTGRRADAGAWVPSQFIGREIRVLNYCEGQGQELAYYVNWMHSQGYTPDNTDIYLPHDGTKGDNVFASSYESALRSAGYSVTVIPNQGAGAAMARVDAARKLFPQIWFDVEKCAGLIDALGWYHEKRDETRDIGLGPEHDWSSHGADAFGAMCIDWRPPMSSMAQEYALPNYGAV